MGAMTPATALLASGIVGGAGSLAGGLLSSSSASSNNSKALDFNKWSQLQAQQFQQQMYNQQKLDQEDFYKKYQSPQAIAKALQQLGVNPASAFGGSTGIGTSPASLPSVPSTPALSAPALENEGAAFSKSIEAIGNAMSSIVASGAQSEQSQEMLYTFNERMNSLILQNSGQQLMNAKAQWDLFAAQNKLPYEIQNMVLKAYADYYAGRHSEALAKLVDIQSYIEDETKDMTIEQRQQANTLLGKQILIASEDANLRKEQLKTEKSIQASNYASARNQSAQASYNTALADIYNDKSVKHSVMEQIRSAAVKARNDGKISSEQFKQMKFATEQAEYANDMKEFTYWTEQVGSIVGSVGDAASAFAVGGAAAKVMFGGKPKPIGFNR